MGKEANRSLEVDAYIAKQSPEMQRALQELRSCIREAAPDAAELLNYGIPAFALVKGGKRDQQIMFAGYPSHVGFYPHPDVIAACAEQLAGYRFAKGSVQFPLDKPIPKALVLRMVKLRLSQLRQ